jgi:pyruvate dehydrogenase E2 component (dihydrolipoamide acetyltransferase)
MGLLAMGCSCGWNSVGEGARDHLAHVVAQVGLGGHARDGFTRGAAPGFGQLLPAVERARKGRLTLAEMERGTFTLSSLATYDITHFTAILNPPQSGILSVGKLDEKLVMVDGQVRVKRITRFGLSVDHRIIDGAVAADFLQNLKWKLEKPAFTFLAL